MLQRKNSIYLDIYTQFPPFSGNPASSTLFLQKQFFDCWDWNRIDRQGP